MHSSPPSAPPDPAKSAPLFVLSSWVLLLWLALYGLVLYQLGSVQQMSNQEIGALSPAPSGPFRAVCVPDSPLFVQAMLSQRRGLPRLYDRHNFESTMTILQRHFNGIWMNAKRQMRARIKGIAADPDEKKYVLRKRKGAQGDCSVITVGVGHNVEAEQQLASWVYSDCEFMGVDPEEAINRKLYTSKLARAKFLRVALGGRSNANTTVHILKPDGKYHVQAVRQLDFFDFLRWYNGATMVDLVLLDAEGAEYAILGRIADEQSPPLCQLNIEIHHPLLVNSSTDPLLDALAKLASDGRFALLHWDSAEHFFPSIGLRTLFTRLFMVNVFHGGCVQRYLC